MDTDQLALSVQMLVDQREVVDSLYRFAAGQDDKDRETFLSAFTPDAVLDFSEPAGRFGVTMPPMRGLDQVATVLEVVAPLRTTHTVTNPRILIDGDRARMQALVAAQHVREGPSPAFLLLKNVYDVRVLRDGGTPPWRIQHLTIRNSWYEGDPGVLFGPGAGRQSDTEPRTGALR